MRWIVEKKLTMVNYMKLLPRDNKHTASIRAEILKELKKAKQDFKTFIREYRIRGYWNSIKK